MEKINLMKSTFYKEKEIKRKLCDFILDTEILSMNKYVKQFENDFSKWQQTDNSVMYNSGSSANLALIQSLLNLNRLKKGDNVGISAITWATNFMPLIQLGLNPVPVDIKTTTLNIHSNNLEATLKEHKLDALFLTHLLGFCGDMDNIKDICDDRKILLLEDTCESIGSYYKSKYPKLGNWGLASTFSTYVGHHISTIEGGMVCTKDEELSNMLKMVRAHGWSRDIDHKAERRLKVDNKVDDFNNKYTFYALGYNLRPTEISGFIGIEQLKYIDEIINKREDNFRNFLYNSKRNGMNEYIIVDYMDKVSNFAFPITTKNKEYRDRIDKYVETRPIVGGNVVKQPVFKKYNKYNIQCPNADYVANNGFYIPNNPELTKEEVKRMCALLRNEDIQ